MNVVDMHCDTISRLLDKEIAGEKASLRWNDCNVDLKKMQKGDYLLQNFACFVYLGNGVDPVKRAHQLIDHYYRQIEANSDLIAPVFCYDDIEKNRSKGLMSALLTIEEGGVVANDLALLRNYYRLGVRMVTLTWNFSNGIGHPNFENKGIKNFQDMKQINTEDGLTEFGIQYIREMEQLGMIIDVSHLSDAGFYDVLKYTKKPFVASHSNARSVCDVARNMSDDMIIKLAERGGVMGINFCGDFLKQSETGGERSEIQDMVKHILYIKKLAGIDCIGLGTDFDGIAPNLEISDASMMPLLKEALEKAGLSEEEIEKIFYRNVLRVYQEVLK